jgi:Protein of unknown function (DUF1696).
MIDFENPEYLKLKPVPPSEYEKLLSPLFISGEGILCAFRTVRDGIVFTNKRLIAINMQGVTGKRKDFTSLPYSRVQAFSIETAGVFDLDCELELWFSGLGKVRFELVGNTNMQELCRTISEFVLRN